MQVSSHDVWPMGGSLKRSSEDAGLQNLPFVLSSYFLIYL